MWPRTSDFTSLSLSFLISQVIITFALQWCRKNPQKVNRKSGSKRCRVRGGCLLGSGLTSSGAHPCSGSPLPAPPSPASLPAQAWPDGGSREMQRAACSWSILRNLLFPLLPGAMWWLRVSAHRMGSELALALPFPPIPSPSLPHGLGPASPTSWLPAWVPQPLPGEGGGQVPKGALAWEHPQSPSSIAEVHRWL